MAREKKRRGDSEKLVFRRSNVENERIVPHIFKEKTIRARFSGCVRETSYYCDSGFGFDVWILFDQIFLMSIIFYQFMIGITIEERVRQANILLVTSALSLSCLRRNRITACAGNGAQSTTFAARKNNAHRLFFFSHECGNFSNRNRYKQSRFFRVVKKRSPFGLNIDFAKFGFIIRKPLFIIRSRGDATFEYFEAFVAVARCARHNPIKRPL